MKLDRNINKDGRGKYALIKLRVDQPHQYLATLEGKAHTYLVSADAIDFGDTPDTDFFVIRLKDKYAGKTLRTYAEAAYDDDEQEYAEEILALAELADKHPNRRRPD